MIIDEMRKENAYLKEKISKIKDVFDMEAPNNQNKAILEDAGSILN